MSSDDTGIQWTDATWNTAIGCRRVSEGCRNCYAEGQAARIVRMDRGRGRRTPYEDVVKMDAADEPRPLWNGRAMLLPERLDQPLRWTRPRLIFANSMSDLFHEDLTDEQIAAVVGVMAAARQHTFQVLTKRSKRLPEWFRWVKRFAEAANGGRGTTIGAVCLYFAQRLSEAPQLRDTDPILAQPWPLPNVWLGVSVEDQPSAVERVGHLLDLEVRAAVRFVSYEPALAGVDFRRLNHPGDVYTIDAFTGDVYEGRVPDVVGQVVGDRDPREPLVDRGCVPALDWVIVGGESGDDARPFDVAWARDVLRQREGTTARVFVKQLGARPVLGDGRRGPLVDVGRGFAVPDDGGPTVTFEPVRLRSKKGGDMAEWPEDLRVREWPAGFVPPAPAARRARRARRARP